VVNRPGVDPAVHAAVPDLGPAARPIRHVAVPPIGIASHDLRRRVAEGRSIRYQVPRGVEAYIAAHGLYARGLR
jgi:nicotinate-nucleotide adenylyltransferase